MTISIRDKGTWVGGTDVVTPTITASAQVGDLMLCAVASKPYNGTNTLPSGWVSIGTATDGTTASGNGVGSVLTEVFWKIHNGNETNPDVSNSSNAVSIAAVIVFQKSSARAWVTPVGAGGGDATAGTGFSVTAGSNPGITTDDMCFAAIGIRDDCTLSSVTFTAASVTFDTVTLGPASNLASTDGDDLSASGVYRLATAGTASAAPVITATLNTNETGSAYLVRLRDAPGNNGSSNKDIGSVTGSATGGLTAAGTSSKDIGSVTGSATGGLTASGISSKDIGSVTGSALGSIPATGTSDKIIASIEGSATGEASLLGTIEGNSNKIISVINTNSAGYLGARIVIAFAEVRLRTDFTIEGISSKIITSITGSATGSIASIGTSDKVIASIEGSATGSIEVLGTSDKVIANITGSAIGGTVQANGISDKVIAIVTGSAIGSIPVTGTSDKIITEITGSGIGSILVTGISDKIITTVIGSAVGGIPAVVGTSDKILTTITGSAIGSLTIAGTSSKILTIIGSATGTLTGSGFSNKEFVLIGNAIGSIPASGNSDKEFIFTSSSTGNVLVTGTSIEQIDISGSASGGVSISGLSNKSLLISGNAIANILIKGISNKAFDTLTGTTYGFITGENKFGIATFISLVDTTQFITDSPNPVAFITDTVTDFTTFDDYEEIFLEAA